MSIHSYRRIQRAVEGGDPKDEAEEVYQVGLVSGADVLDSRQFVVMAEYDNPTDAAAFVAYLNGGPAPAVLPSAGRDEDEDEHPAKRVRGGHR
jgi:hypothetical protein